MNRYGVFSFLLLLLLAACGESHEQMLRQLEKLERMNRADSVMHNDTLAEQLTKYFDRHGDSNERMRAHYILGRTYADMGEAPAALNAYLDAVDAADTTAVNCDYHTLSRVYGQMADIFYEQNLIDDNLSSADYASYYAWKDKDTVQALSEQMLKIGTYIYMKQHDLVITLFDSLYKQMLLCRGEEIASRYCTLPVVSLLEYGKTAKASSYLDIYRFKSGYFDSSGNIEEGREAYYYLKGQLCYSQYQIDSAIFYFKKELQEGTDIANQSMATHGLSLAFQKMNQTDSAAKYGIISYEMNDSAYMQIATHEVSKAKALYNYHRHQEIANKEHLRAEKKYRENRQLYELLVIICLIACCSVYVWHRKKKAAAARLKEKIEELEKLQTELQGIQARESGLHIKLGLLEDTIKLQKENVARWQEHEDEWKSLIESRELQIEQKETEMNILRAHEAELKKIIEDKEKETAQKITEKEELCQYLRELELSIEEKEARVDQLSMEIANYRRSREQEKNEIERGIIESELYKKFKSRFIRGGELNKRELEKLDDMSGKLLPGFHQFIASKRHSLTECQYHLCLLFRFHLDVNQSASLLGVSPSYVSKISKDILMKLFKEEGNGLLLKKRLEEISE